MRSNNRFNFTSVNMYTRRTVSIWDFIQGTQTHCRHNFRLTAHQFKGVIGQPHEVALLHLDMKTRPRKAAVCTDTCRQASSKKGREAINFNDVSSRKKKKKT